MSMIRASINEIFYPLPETHVTRTGVIPFALSEDTEFWLLGRLVKSNRYSDFGGQCLVTIGETPYECLLREVEEESNGLLNEEIKNKLDSIFEAVDIHHQDVDDQIIVWKWINRNNPQDLSYLIFIELDNPDLVDITDRFEGNEENRLIGWYDLKYLQETATISDFNTSIQKYLRQLGLFKKTSA